MDGFKKRLKLSLQSRLSFTLALVILVVAAAAGTFSFISAIGEAYELQDGNLRQIASLIDQLQPKLGSSDSDVRLTGGDAESSITIQALSKFKQDGDPARLPVPVELSDGLHTVVLNAQSYRILVKTMANSERFAVTQPTAVRDEIAIGSALHTLLTLLVLVPILILLIASLVRKIFRPVTDLAEEINLRREQDLRPMLEKELPIEVEPFVVAINRLFSRVDQMVNTQRRFIADAAHELRSPMTALSLQAERLASAEMSDEARKRLGLLRQGIERGRNLLDQLLTLARLQSVPERPRTGVSIQGIYRRVIEDLMPLVDVKHIDMGVEGDQDALIYADENDLIVLIRNLVDNAIRYTPEGGQVDLGVKVVGDTVVLRIQDNGPGIPVTEHIRVFDPFYRVLGNVQSGSGLGLSIVQTIAKRIGADIQLNFSDESKQKGLSVVIRLPTCPRNVG